MSQGVPNYILLEERSIDVAEDPPQEVGDALRRRIFTNGGFMQADLKECPFADFEAGGQWAGNTRVIRTIADRDPHLRLHSAWKITSTIELIISISRIKGKAPFRILYHPSARHIEGWVDLPVTRES